MFDEIILFSLPWPSKTSASFSNFDSILATFYGKKARINFLRFEYLSLSPVYPISIIILLNVKIPFYT